MSCHSHFCHSLSDSRRFPFPVDATTGEESHHLLLHNNTMMRTNKYVKQGPRPCPCPLLCKPKSVRYGGDIDLGFWKVVAISSWINGTAWWQPEEEEEECPVPIPPRSIVCHLCPDTPQDILHGISCSCSSLPINLIIHRH